MTKQFPLNCYIHNVAFDTDLQGQRTIFVRFEVNGTRLGRGASWPETAPLEVVLNMLLEQVGQDVKRVGGAA